MNCQLINDETITNNKFLIAKLGIIYFFLILVWSFLICSYTGGA